jgi:hypothetical protein
MTVETPEGFADRVMGRIEQHRRQRRAIAAAVCLKAVLSSKWGRIAICSAAGAAYVARVSSLLSLFFASV